MMDTVLAIGLLLTYVIAIAGEAQGTAGLTWQLISSLGLLALSCWAIYRGRWQAVGIAIWSVIVFTLCLFPGFNTPFWLSILLAGLGAATVYLLWLSPIPRLPAPTGCFPVGVRKIFCKDDDRSGLFCKSTGGRDIQAFVWYPIDPEPNTPCRAYRTPLEAEAVKDFYRCLGIPKFLDNQWQLVATQSHENAAIRAGKYPLIVFCHGGALTPQANTALMQELASHGYIVASVGHPGESASVIDQSGTSIACGAELINMMKTQGGARSSYARLFLEQDRSQKRVLLEQLSKHDKDYTVLLSREWAYDNIALVDSLEHGELANSLPELAARIDFSQIAYMGMSLGGSAAHESCFLDSRAKAGINLDGMNWGYQYLEKEIPTAFLQVYSDPSLIFPQLQKLLAEDVETPSLSPAIGMCNDLSYESLDKLGERDDIIRLIIRDTGHMALTDKALASRAVLRKFNGMGSLSGQQAINTINHLCLKFLNVTLRGEARDGLDDFIAAEKVLLRQELQPEQH